MLFPTRSVWFVSEEEHKQDRHSNGGERGEEEEGRMSLWMLETEAPRQGNTLAVKHFAGPTLTVTGCIAHA